MTDSRQKQDDPFSRKSVRDALKSWDSLQRLGAHALVRLNVVEVRRRAKGYPDTPAGRGLALRDFFRQAIQDLKPEDQEPNLARPEFREKRWRPFIIVKNQYIDGRPPGYLAQQLLVARSTYDHEQARALDLLADILREREHRHNTSGPPTRPLDGRQVPFLAPPRPPYDLVGRDELLYDLKQQLFAGRSVGLFALNGLPGVGKTALAIELAHDPQVLEHFRDGVLWAGLGRRPDVLSHLGAWGRAVGLSADQVTTLTSVKEWAKTIRAVIGMRRMLIVVDDAWQVEAALAFRLGGPHCAHLVTTRLPQVAVHFAGEGATTVCELSQTAGAALLERLAPEAVKAEPEKARALVRAVDGLPLALTLMGKYLRVMALSGPSRHLGAALDRLRQAKARLRLAQPQAPLESQPSLPEKSPLSLLVSIGISDASLDGTARRALRSLSVLPPRPDTFSREAALAVSAAPSETLDQLADYGLLERSGPDRYALHQTIADYARLKLTDDTTYSRLVAFFVHYLETHARDYAALELETSNILAALQIALDREMHAAVVRGANAFYHFLETRGLYALAEDYMERARQAARLLGDAPGLTTALLNLGRIAERRGDYERAEMYSQEGLALAREIEDHEKISALLNNLGAVAFKRGDILRAEEYLREGWAVAKETRDRARIVALLRGLGVVATRRGDYARAEACYQEGLALAHEIGDHERTSILLVNLGVLAFKRGDQRQAETYYQEGLALAREIGHRETVSVLLQNLGTLAGNRGGLAQAEAYFQEGLTLAREMGHPETISHFLLNLGWVAESFGYDEQAEAYFQEGLALTRETGHLENTSYFLADLGKMATKRGSYTQAETYFQEGLALARKLGDRETVCYLLMNIGAAAVNRGDCEQAQECLGEGLVLAREVGYRRYISIVLNEWGELYLKRQALDSAEAAFCEALEIARKGEMQEQVAVALYGLGRVMAAQGKVIKARQQGQEGLAVFEAIGHHEAAKVAQWLATLTH